MPEWLKTPICDLTSSEFYAFCLFIICLCSVMLKPPTFPCHPEEDEFLFESSAYYHFFFMLSQRAILLLSLLACFLGI